MSAKHIQYGLAAIFIALGGWCLLLPQMVESLGFRPEYQEMSATSAVLIGCFGAQAVLAGTVIATSEFTARTFLIFGLLGSVPFFLFNAYFYFIVPMFTDWMLLDFAGNIGILAFCIVGYRLNLAERADRIICCEDQAQTNRVFLDKLSADFWAPTGAMTQQLFWRLRLCAIDF